MSRHSGISSRIWILFPPLQNMLYYTALQKESVLPRWRCPLCPWFCLRAGPGTRWRTPWWDTWWAAAAGRPSADSLHGGSVKPLTSCYLLRLWCIEQRGGHVVSPQVAALHPLLHPVLPASMVCPSRVRGPHFDLEPHHHLPVRDPHECKAAIQDLITSFKRFC